MAEYLLTSPDGQKFKVTAPDNATNEQVMQFFQNNIGSQPTPKAGSITSPQTWKEAFKQAGSGVLEGAMGVVNTPMEFVRAAGEVTGIPRNYLPLSTQELYQRNIESGLTVAPKTGFGAIRFGGNVLGSSLTLPSVKPSEPVQSLKQQALAQGQKEGFVVPPSEVKPTPVNTILESISGKAATRQAASANNQEILNQAARESLGVNSNQPLTIPLLRTLRDEAGNVYNQAKSLGTFNVDRVFRGELNSISGQTSALKAELPQLADKNIQPIVKAFSGKQTLSSEATVEAIKSLRASADDAFAQGTKQYAKALRGIADALESLMERNVANSNPGFLDQFRNARALIAKTYTVEKALNPATGDINGAVWARELAKGRPLSGAMRTAAQFAAAFPKNVQRPEMAGSPNVSKLQALLASILSGVGGATHGPGGIVLGALPFVAPPVARSVLFSGPVQQSLLASKGLDPNTTRLMLGAALSGMNLRGQ